MPELGAGGLRIYDERRGRGQPLLLLDGSGATLATSGRLVDLLVPGADLRVYEGGHAFFAQDRHALPEILDFLAEP